ncbi:Transposase [Alkalibacterium putridalgicola]|jgi:transposase|uniref:Transposase n=3 Tax=Alkalibacterium putridalgicola TaxID=426703 RepID=A0A1H7XWM0_9LACT|nr:IS110 family transposase [Alkalibacterium putridalgicola]GEK90372.1 IS110 family transposase [Alkalibacterium putridalgicola]SEM38342.1 Transposase [Alkalibacterium putridalgicola]
MFFLGIDIGKRSHVASVMNEEGKVILKGFSFPNSTEGGEKLLQKIISLSPIDQYKVGMEATGHYWLSLFSFLDEHDFLIHVINPIQTDGWRKGTEIRKRKNDIIDSVLIADLMRYGTFVETSLSDENIFSLKQLSRYRTYLVGTASDFKRKIIAVLDQVFPEYDTLFSKVGIFGKASKEVLLELSSPDAINHISAGTLADLLGEASRNRLGMKKAEELKTAASHSFGVKFAQETFTFQLRSMIEQLKFLEKQITDTEKEIKKIMDDIDSVIETIPGIGPINGATILGEIGDINKFSSPAKLVAYAGIDASVTQSGEFEGTHNVMSKRGSPYLRKALFSAALVASRHDPVLKAFYEKKISEGKHHLTALGAVSRKLCYIIYAILKKNEPYEVRLK